MTRYRNNDTIREEFIKQTPTEDDIIK